MGALGGLQCAVLVWGSGAPTATQLFAVLTAAALGGAALLWIAFDTRFAQTPLAWVFGLALVLRLMAVQADPLLEDDHYRYLWDGMRTARYFDPYRLAPAAFFGADELAPRWQDILSGINNPDIPTLYGPVLQALFALAHWLAPGRVGAIQGLVLLVDLGCFALLARLGVASRGLLVYALHPMILKEAMASAHPDGLVALWLLLAVLAWRRERMGFTGVLLGLAVATKVAALLVVPLFLFAPQRTLAFGRTSSAVALGFVLALGAAYLPFLAGGTSDALGLQTFAAQWRFNPLLYRVIEAAVPNGMARPVAALTITAGMAALLWRWRVVSTVNREMAMPPVDSVFLLLLLFAPVVNPWYALWALAPAIAARRPLVPVMGCVGVLAYLNGSTLQEAVGQADTGLIAPYSVPWPVALVQVTALILAAAWVRRSNSRKETTTGRD